MRELRLRLAKQFAQNHTSSSWQYPNFNRDGIAPKSIVLSEEAAGETSLPRCLLLCETPLVILPEMCPCFATLQVLCFMFPPFCFLNTLPSFLVVGGPCAVCPGWSSRLEHFIVSRKPFRALDPCHSSQHFSKETAPSALHPTLG